MCRMVRHIQLSLTFEEGTEKWSVAETEYNQRIFKVEHQIIQRLRDRLSASKNAQDMFRTFSKFNALFIRPKIRGAIHEYQTQLIEHVKEDIKILHDKFMQPKSSAEALVFSRVRDIPSVSGSIIWAKNIERQLGLLMKKVEYVLGSGWELYAEGQKLKQEEIAFRKQLDTSNMFQSWVAEESKREPISGRIFSLSTNTRTKKIELTINFDPSSVSIFKEVRNLRWLEFQVPSAIENAAKEAKRVYPFALTLTEAVRIYQKTLALIEANQKLEPLVAEFHAKIKGLISRGLQLRWDYFINTVI